MKKRYSLRKGESGQTLIFVAIMLLFIGLIIPSLLALTFTSHRSAQTREQKMTSFYAADAGVEAAIRQLMNESLFPTPPPLPTPVTFELNVNDRNVSVVIEEPPGTPTYYKITSKADITSYTAKGFGGGTTAIEAYLFTTTYNAFDNAITSRGNVNIQPGVTVDGPLQYGGTLDNKGTIIGNYFHRDVITWPTAQEFYAYYWPEVENYPLAQGTIDVKDTSSIGPGYTEGDLEIGSSDNKEVRTATLQGTVYVKGNLDIGKAGGSLVQPFELDLNFHTIYVTGSLTMSNVVQLTGSGCLIAVGDVIFAPKAQTSSDDFVFVMSVEGEVQFQPSANFNGALAGDVNIQLQPGGAPTFTFTNVGKKSLLGFPVSMIARVDSKLQTYIIKE